jgi:hypothetical protein
MKKITIKSTLLIFGIIFFYACSSKNYQNNGDYTSESIEEIINKPNAFHLKLNIDSLLNSYKTIVSNLGKDELIFSLDSVIESDPSRVVVIGKFINKNDVFALDIYGNWQTQNIYFYKFGNGVWEKLQSDDYNWDIVNFSFANFNNDEDAEILILAHPNMNGNRENTIYKYDERENKFVKSISLFATELSYDSISNLLHYQYFGSWYMNSIQTEYQWNNYKLIPLKSVEKQYKNTSVMNNGKEWIRYYENPTQDKDTLVLKFRKTYNEKNKKLYDLWENFFDKK